MTEQQIGRMLLSHNFEVTEDILPVLNREEFAQIFTEGLQDNSKLKVRQLNHAHWMVEILFPQAEFSASQVGKLCAEALLKSRINQKKNAQSFYDILILGGFKTTPPLSDDPETLQTGEWGVDVVETLKADDFLTKIEWAEKTANKTNKQVFKIELKNN